MHFSRRFLVHTIYVLYFSRSRVKPSGITAHPSTGELPPKKQSSIPGNVIVDCCRILCTFFSVEEDFIHHFFQQRRIDCPYHLLNRLAITEKFERGSAPDAVAFGSPLTCQDVDADKDDRIPVFRLRNS